MNEQELQKLGEWISTQVNYAKGIGQNDTERGKNYAILSLEVLENFCKADEKTRHIHIKLN